MSEEQQKKDSPESSNTQTGRRGLLKKAAIGTPILMTLINRPAYGAICTISGFQSASPVNPSGVARHTVNGGCGGFSHGAWGNGMKTTGDGNRFHWLTTTYNPNPREGHDDPTDTTNYDGDATLFNDVFAASSRVSSEETLFEVVSPKYGINHNGSVEAEAVGALLNSIYFGWGVGDGKISPLDVVGLYDAYVKGDNTYTILSSGSTVDISGLTDEKLKDFFEQLHD